MSWALIAGGSKGLGYSIAEALCKRHYNLVLVARERNGLLAAEKKLEERYPIEVRIISCDLSLPDSVAVIHDYCVNEGLVLNILCNAAGMGGAIDFPELPLNDLRKMVSVNLDSAIALSFSLLTLLKTHAPSYILNIGSMAGFAPFPIKNVYSASKAAILYFSYSLDQQLRDSNISVSCLCPGPLFTKPEIERETIKKLKWLGKQMNLDVQMVGEWAVRDMLKKKKLIIPGKLVKIMSFILRVLPARFMAHLIYRYGYKAG